MWKKLHKPQSGTYMSFKQPEGSWHLFTGYKELKFELEVPEIITISSKYKIKDILDLNLNLFKPIISIAQLVFGHFLDFFWVDIGRYDLDSWNTNIANTNMCSILTHTNIANIETNPKKIEKIGLGSRPIRKKWEKICQLDTIPIRKKMEKIGRLSRCR